MPRNRIRDLQRDLQYTVFVFARCRLFMYDVFVWLLLNIHSRKPRKRTGSAENAFPLGNVFILRKILAEPFVELSLQIIKQIGRTFIFPQCQGRIFHLLYGNESAPLKSRALQ